MPLCETIETQLDKFLKEDKQGRNALVFGSFEMKFQRLVLQN